MTAGQTDMAAPDGGETAQAEQEAPPLALVRGKPVTSLPANLYIPPDALEVFLESFEGPLDLLLYLIRRQNLDIRDIQVSLVTEQYMQYMELMRELHLDLAAEYLVMAALLAEIKSRSLLPRQADEEEEETDPRAELIRRLQEYERFRTVAEELDGLPRLNRDFWQAKAAPPRFEQGPKLPEVDLQELLLAFAEVLARSDLRGRHQVVLESLSTRERMSQVLAELQARRNQFVPFLSLFTPEEGRQGVIVTFLAIMELMRDQLILLVQAEPFSPIHVRLPDGEGEAAEARQPA